MGKHKKKQGSQKLGSADTNTLRGLSAEILKICLHTGPELPRDILERFNTLYALLERVRELESGVQIPTPKRSLESIDRLIQWGVLLGCYVKHIEIKSCSEAHDEYGVFATQELQEADIFLSVPYDIMMTSEGAGKCKYLGELMKDDPILKEMSNVQLAMFLLNELALGTESRYCSYIEDVWKVYKSIARQYVYFDHLFQMNSVARQLPFRSFFTFDLYRWAVSTVMTRQNSVPSPSGSGMLQALIPLWDMCNHANGKTGTDYDVKSQQLVSFATRAYHKGEEVRIFYGPRSNAQFFVHNGFVHENNEFDAITLHLGISKSDALYAMKARFCAKMHLPTTGSFDIKKAPDGEGVLLTKMLLQFLHILTWKANRPSSTANSGDTDDSLTEEDSAPNVQRVTDYLQTRAKLLLATFNKTVEELEEIAGNLENSAIRRLTARYRLTERKMLEATLTKVQFTAC